VRPTLRKTALVATAAIIGLATASVSGSAEAADAAKLKTIRIPCESKQHDKGILYVTTVSWGIYDVKYQIKLKGHGTTKANDIEVRDDGPLTSDEKYTTRKAWSNNQVRAFPGFHFYGRTAGYFHVKFIFDIPKKKDHWCTAKKWISAA
jgi:hypothetical protein